MKTQATSMHSKLYYSMLYKKPHTQNMSSLNQHEIEISKSRSNETQPHSRGTDYKALKIATQVKHVAKLTLTWRDVNKHCEIWQRNFTYVLYFTLTAHENIGT